MCGQKCDQSRVGEALSEPASALGSHGGSPSRDVSAGPMRSIGSMIERVLISCLSTFCLTRTRPRLRQRPSVRFQLCSKFAQWPGQTIESGSDRRSPYHSPTFPPSH